MKIYFVIVALLLAGLMSSCIAQKSLDSQIEPVPQSTITKSKGTEQESYSVQPGDQLEIKFYYNSDLNSEVIVRPDGKIALQLVGEVQAAGLTLSELDEKLTESYSHDLLQPEITINVSEFEGPRIYVGGEVTDQGFIAFRNNMTPLQAILNSGGFKKSANPRSTLVIRKDQNNKPVSIIVDLAMVLAGKDNDSELLLLPDDIVYVPKLQ